MGGCFVLLIVPVWEVHVVCYLLSPTERLVFYVTIPDWEVHVLCYRLYLSERFISSVSEQEVHVLSSAFLEWEVHVLYQLSSNERFMFCISDYPQVGSSCFINDCLRVISTFCVTDWARVRYSFFVLLTEERFIFCYYFPWVEGSFFCVTD